MCCSRASLACSDFTRASVDIRSSLLYSSFGEVPIFRCSSFTASENADVAGWYSLASRAFSSQSTSAPSSTTILSRCPGLAFGPSFRCQPPAGGQRSSCRRVFPTGHKAHDRSQHNDTFGHYNRYHTPKFLELKSSPLTGYVN